MPSGKAIGPRITERMAVGLGLEAGFMSVKGRILRTVQSFYCHHAPLLPTTPFPLLTTRSLSRGMGPQAPLDSSGSQITGYPGIFGESQERTGLGSCKMGCSPECREMGESGAKLSPCAIDDDCRAEV